MNSSMIAFIAIGIVLVCCAVALVAVPLLRHREGRSNAPGAATVAAMMLPALALMMYVSVSNFDWSSAPLRASAPAQSQAANSGGEMSEVVSQLEQRLAEAPDDAEGWMLLGRSYVQLSRMSDARNAFQKALELAPTNVAKLSLAEVDIIADRATLGGEAGHLVEEVLAEEPENAKALFYGGMVALFRGDNDLVRARWQKLLGMSPPDNVRALLEQQLAQIGVEPLAEPEPAAAGDGFAVNVSIADELASRLNGNEVVFVLARQPGVPGPPIAAVRTSAGQLPASLQISDANAMIEGRTLSNLDAVELVARVSNGGGPIAASGDLFGEVTWRAASDGSRDVTIVIDQIVE